MSATSMVFGRGASANEEQRCVRIAGNPGIRICHSRSVRDKSANSLIDAAPWFHGGFEYRRKIASATLTAEIGRQLYEAILPTAASRRGAPPACAGWSESSPSVHPVPGRRRANSGLAAHPRAPAARLLPGMAFVLMK